MTCLLIRGFRRREDVSPTELDEDRVKFKNLLFRLIYAINVGGVKIFLLLCI